MKYHLQDLNRTYVTGDGNRKIPMPRYYRNRIFADVDLSFRQKEIHEKQVALEKERFADFKSKYPDMDYNDYWEEKNARRRASYVNMVNQNLKKSKL